MISLITEPETTIILPAAGFGTRVNADRSTGKELMLDPVKRVPLITYAIELGLSIGAHVVVATRSDKTGLNEYIENSYAPNLVTLDVQPAEAFSPDGTGHGWVETVLCTTNLWTEKNILMLPDTRFPMARGVLRAIEEDLTRNEYSLGVFNMPQSECSKFAVYTNGHMCEKPTSVRQNMLGVGLWGFREDWGSQMFLDLMLRGKWFRMAERPSLVKLEWFKDITRNGEVEGYLNE